MEKKLDNIAILGAAGKMGCGIALVLLQEIALAAQEQDHPFSLKLIDPHEKAFPQVRRYLRAHMKKYAEKQIIRLREIYKNNPSLISNEEVIDYFVNSALDSVILSSSLEDVAHSKIVFEAIVEDLTLKVEVLKKAGHLSSQETLFLSNTSSIPIHILNEQAGLNNRIIGFHFYNPPLIQKLIEIIVPDQIDPTLVEFADSLADRFKKVVVYSADIAGFIGNGHFIREALFACRKVQELVKTMPLSDSVGLINKITKEYLLRPMGIFQLIDYVGIDVVKKIAGIMHLFLQDPEFENSLIDLMISRNIKGGQHSDGTQKPGFFDYKKNDVIGYYDFVKQHYLPVKIGLDFDISKELSWKSLVQNPNKEDLIKAHFENLTKSKEIHAKMALEFLEYSKRISHDLVDQKVARSLSDVIKVLKYGFYHLY